MSRRLAALRRGLDVLPSPVPDRPGALLRDPLRYTEDLLVVPPPLVPYLSYFDGSHDEDDLAAALVRSTGDIGAGRAGRHLAQSLARAGFLEDEELERRRAERHRAFAEAPRREPGPLREVEARDRARIAALLAGDPRGFWRLVQEREDDINWCGASVLYAFVKAVGPRRGVLLRYEQWNIDPASVVSFAGLAFSSDEGAAGAEGGIA